MFYCTKTNSLLYKGWTIHKETRDQITNINWIIELDQLDQKNSEKHLFLLHWLRKDFGCVDNNKLWKIVKRDGNTKLSHLPPEKPVHRSRSKQLEPDMEQQTGFKLGKEYINTVYCHPAYVTYMQNTSCEMRGWMRNRSQDC